MNFILPILLIVGVVIWQKVQAAKNLDFSLQLPRNIRISGGYLTFELPIAITNANQININVNGINLDVYFSNNIVGKAYALNAQRIEAGKVTTLVCTVNIGLIALATSASSILADIKGKKVNLKLNGQINAEGFNVPIDLPYSLTIPFI